MSATVMGGAAMGATVMGTTVMGGAAMGATVMGTTVMGATATPCSCADSGGTRNGIHQYDL